MDIEQLEKQLTYSEYEAGRDLFGLCKERHMPFNKMAGIIYRAGWLAGSANERFEQGDLQGRLRGANDCLKERHGKEVGRLHRIINYLKQRYDDSMTNADILEQLNAETQSPSEAIEEETKENER